NGRRATVPSQQFQQTVTSQVAATGHVVVFDLWSNWPGRRLPPMPNPNTQGPANSKVSVSLDQWPGEDELPLPDLSGGAPAPLRTSTAARLASRAASSDT